METIDWSSKGLKTVIPNWVDENNVQILILDHNELSNFDGIQNLQNLQKLSAAKNRIRRMSYLPNLANLTSLDLSNNSIVAIEGLKTLKALQHLNLSGNFIKIIDHFTNNLALEHLDLSNNAIGHINDISYLKQLKELFLHKNHISHLRQSDRYLPNSIEVFTLSENNLVDIAEISHLENLSNLKKLTLKGNPCVETSTGKQAFNYRPYLKMWCLTLTIVDDEPLDPLESLKAEWLYSQGRGRRFRPGDNDLPSFLSSVCPLPTKMPSAAEDRKLLLILSKAEQYKQQLRDQSGDAESCRMAVSYHDAVTRHSARASPELMSRSLDVSVLRNSPPSSHRTTAPNTPARSGTPLQAASTLVPVPESLVSPDVVRPLHPLPQTCGRSTRSPLATPPTNGNGSPHSTPGRTRRTTQRSSATNSPKSTPTKTAVRNQRVLESQADGMTPRNLQNIQLRASQKRHKQAQTQVPNMATEKKIKVSPISGGGDLQNGSERENGSSENGELATWKAAVSIQRRWRGYRARTRDASVTEACRTVQASRMQDYIMKFAEDMEATKTALEGNRKLQVLQMKAIDAVWRKLDGSDVNNLAASCITLQKQVEELRGLVQALPLNCPRPAAPVSTQTDIIAVHTPQEDAVFPIQKRPSGLPIAGTAGESNRSPSKTEASTFSEPVCLTPACQEGRDLGVSPILSQSASPEARGAIAAVSPTYSLD